MPPKLVYDIALALVTKRKWHVVDARPPAAGRRDAVIEAVARTPIMGFRDDVVIRVSATGDGARVDMRSASRYGLHDFGANAARIRSLLEDIDDAVSSAPEPRPEPEKKASAAQAGAGQAINAVDRRHAVGLDQAARHQILQMRQHREARPRR